MSTLYNLDGLAKVIADDLVRDLKHFRNADTESRSERIVCLADLKEEYQEEVNMKQSIYSGKKVNLDRRLFWEIVIQKKIVLINKIGGIKLMAKVCSELEKHPEERIYHFSSAFDRLADGIGNWIS
mgnify:CR=1 FL=1